MAGLRSVLALACLLAAARSAAQQMPLLPGDGKPREEKKDEPGLFRVGPLWVTPFFRLASLGVDTNVFYSATDRQADFTASGGPGVELVAPLARRARFVVRGAVDYVYFARTPSQRQLGGDVVERFEWKRGRTELAVEENQGRSFRRPSLEVDTRVLEDVEGTRVDVRRALFGHVRVHARGTRARRDVGDDAAFLGQSLRATLTDRELGGLLGLEYALTPKTTAVVQWQNDRYRFPFDAIRDGSLRRITAGLETDASALVTGHVLLGAARFRAADAAGRERAALAVDVDATWNVSPRVRLGGGFVRGLAYSAFDPLTGTPTLAEESYGFRLEQELVPRRVDARLGFRRTRFAGDGSIAVTLADGSRAVLVRDDVTREVALDVGYRFRSRLRVGVVGTYANRRSTVADFGIAGLLMGASLTYTP